MGREQEYKYKGTEAAFAALEQRFGPFTQIRMETTSTIPRPPPFPPGGGRCGGGWKTAFPSVL